MAATTGMLLAQGIGALTGAGSSFANAYASRARGHAESALYRQDADFANYQADEALKRGEVETSRLLHDVRRLQAAQKVGFAKAGVKVGVGSAADVVEDSAELGVIDATMIRNNAIREAFGYKTKALGSNLSAKMSRLEGRYGAGSSVMQGIGGLAQAGAYGTAAYNRYRGLSLADRASSLGSQVGASVGSYRMPRYF